MKSFQPPVSLSLALLLACTTAAAQPVYRCANSYSQTPCGDAHGPGTAVPTDDPRSEAQRTAAHQALGRDKQLAHEMEASRHRDEAQALARWKAEQAAQAAQAHAAALHKKAEEKKARPGKKPAKARSAQAPEPGVFTATVAAPKSKKKTK